MAEVFDDCEIEDVSTLFGAWDTAPAAIKTRQAAPTPTVWLFGKQAMFFRRTASRRVVCETKPSRYQKSGSGGLSRLSKPQEELPPPTKPPMKAKTCYMDLPETGKSCSVFVSCLTCVRSCARVILISWPLRLPAAPQQVSRWCPGGAPGVSRLCPGS